MDSVQNNILIKAHSFATTATENGLSAGVIQDNVFIGRPSASQRAASVPHSADCVTRLTTFVLGLGEKGNILYHRILWKISCEVTNYPRLPKLCEAFNTGEFSSLSKLKRDLILFFFHVVMNNTLDCKHYNLGTCICLLFRVIDMA